MFELSYLVEQALEARPHRFGRALRRRRLQNGLDVGAYARAGRAQIQDDLAVRPPSKCEPVVGVEELDSQLGWLECVERLSCSVSIGWCALAREPQRLHAVLVYQLELF